MDEKELEIEVQGKAPWERQARRVILECPWLSHYADTVHCSDGREIEFHAIEYPLPVVGVVLLNDEGKILLTKQYRYMVGTYDWELPAGNADTNEDLEAAARRETLEETGYEMEECLFVRDCFPQIGRSNHHFHLFFGHVKKAPQKPYDGGETFGLKWFSQEEAKALIDKGFCRDGFAMLAIYMWLSGAFAPLTSKGK